MSISMAPGGYRPSQATLLPTLPVVPLQGAPLVVSTRAATSSISVPSYNPAPSAAYVPVAPVPYGAPLAPPTSSGAVYAAPLAGFAQPSDASPASFGSDDGEKPREGGAFTRGFPDPASIEEQKFMYGRSLEQQLEHGHKSLQEQNAERKRQLYEAAEQQKQALLLHMEQQVKMQEMALDEQTNQAMVGLKKAALDQRAALEQQAASLTLEYQHRKMQEEFAATQAEMQKQYLDSHNLLQGEVQKQFTDSQRALQSELQRQQQERSQKLGDSSVQLPPPPTPSQVPMYGAPASFVMQTSSAIPATYMAVPAPAMTASYSALPGSMQPMQARYG